MRSKILFTSLCAFSLCISGCKMRTDSGSSSGLDSLSAADINAIVNGTNKFDANEKKVMIFIESDNELSNGGQSFILSYLELLQNNLGSNYSLYVLSNAQVMANSADWFTDFLNASQGIPASVSLIKNVQYAERLVSAGPNGSISRLIAKLSQDLGPKASRPAGQKVQVILHFLAHGLSMQANGDGFVGIDSGTLSWNDIDTQILEPISALSDETIGVFESCFGGNIATDLPNAYFYQNNVMLILGAPPWASQWAPTKEGGQNANLTLAQILGHSMEQYFTTSAASLSLKYALMGYASEGWVGETQTLIDPNAPITFGQDTAKLFDGTNLKEKHVVRVDEFGPYVEQKSNLIYCKFAEALRYKIIQGICQNGSVDSVDLEVGPGIQDADADLRTQLPPMLRGTKPDFITWMRTAFPIPQSHVMFPLGQNQSLNPTRGTGTDSILSVVNLNIFSDNKTLNVAGVNKFAALDQEGIASLPKQVSDCLDDLDKYSSDLYDLGQAILNLPPAPANPSTSPMNSNSGNSTNPQSSTTPGTNQSCSIDVSATPTDDSTDGSTDGSDYGLADDGSDDGSGDDNSALIPCAYTPASPATDTKGNPAIGGNSSDSAYQQRWQAARPGLCNLYGDAPKSLN